MSAILKISKDLNLIEITIHDVAILQELMHRVYTPPYKHLWEDDGIWYVKNTFSSATLKEELANNNAGYYFVTYQNERIGILRLVHNAPLKGFENKKATKLHRIYLDPKIHRKGIGKLLMDWTAREAIKKNSELLWLEAMDTQEQALQFYKRLGYKISNDFRLTFELMHKHLRGMYRMYLTLS